MIDAATTAISKVQGGLVKSKELLLVGLLAACAPLLPQPKRPLDSQRYVLTRAELAQLDPLETAHAVLVRLRPAFLNPRPGARTARGEPPVIKVFVNGHLAGGVEVLLNIFVHEIEEIRQVQPREADRVFGGARGMDSAINILLRSSAAARDPRGHSGRSRARM